MPTSAAGTDAGGPMRRGRSADHDVASRRRFAERGRGAPRYRGEHGFTLVELMVVVTVIALTSAIAMLAIPTRGGPREEAARFAARVRAAHDLAIVGGRPTAIWVTGGGYGFDTRIDGAWVPIADKPLRVERWDATTQVATDASGRVRVVFDTTGMADQGADVRLTRGEDAATVTIGADGGVRVE